MSENYNPVSSGFIGSYRSVYITSGLFNLFEFPVICESFSENVDLGHSTINTFDGKGISTINSIGNFDQGMSLNNSPVVIGTHSDYLDGRDFFFYSLNNLFPFITGLSAPYELPLMKSATLNIGDTEANMSFSMVSDGVRAYGFGSGHELYLNRPSGNLMDFCDSSNRTAYNKDFIFAFGPYKAFVIGGDFNVSININEIYPVRQTAVDTVGQSSPLNSLDSNRQYKVLVPGKVTIQGSGKALIDIEDCVFNTTFETNYNKSGYSYLSKQDPGVLNLFKQKILPYGNQFELYIQNGNTYEKFFSKLGQVGIEILSSYLTSSNMQATTDEITVDFKCLLNARLVIF